MAAKIGGQAFGAYDGARMIGFCLSIPGIKPGGTPYLHSHMLGVLEPYRHNAESAAASSSASARMPWRAASS